MKKETEFKVIQKREITSTEWVNLWHDCQVHPTKSIMTDMISDALGFPMSELFKLSERTLSYLYVGLIKKGVLK